MKSEKDECKLCERGTASCSATIDWGVGGLLFCTRDAGHTGPHAACGGKHPITVWADYYNEESE